MDKIKLGIQFCKEHEKKLKIAAVIIILIAAVLFFGLKGENDTIQIDQVIAETETTETDGAGDTNQASEKTGNKIFVDISGEVVKPGVYEVKEGARVYEIVEKAGGLTDKADTTNINQAEVATDGQKIIIPSVDDVAGISGTTGTTISGVVNGIVNINSADSTGLQEIPGVGPSTAEKIISYRETNGRFKTKEDIKKVSGIGDKTFEKIKDKITV